MVSSKKKRKKQLAKEPAESRTSEAMTVAWTVTLTTLFFSNLAAIAAHFFVVANPAAERMAMLRELLLYAGIVVGVLSLGLMPLVYRLRQAPPPRGLVAFGVCLALAPIMAVALRAMR